MNTELLEVIVAATETDAAEQKQEVAIRALADAELFLVGGGGGDVIWG